MHSISIVWDRFVRPLLQALLLPAGMLAGEPVVLTRGLPPENPRQPQVAVDASDAVHVVYGAGDRVLYHRSDDGRTFTRANEVSFGRVMSLGMRRGPRIAAVGRTICITAIGGKQGRGRDGDLLAMRSENAGKTWTGPVRVNDVADSAREGLHAMAAGPSGELCCVWLDLRRRSTEIMAATSRDGGQTWSPNTLVYRSPDGSVCECCHPSVAYDVQGRVHVQWRNSLSGNRDMYLATSADEGRTFGAAVKSGAGTWPLRACPMDGGALAVAGDQIASVWRREHSVYLSLSRGDQEHFLGTGEQPWIAANSAGLFVVWLTKRGDVLRLLAPGDASPRELASQAFDPVVAAGPWGSHRVVAAWESRDGMHSTVQCQVVSGEPPGR